MLEVALFTIVKTANKPNDHEQVKYGNVIQWNTTQQQQSKITTHIYTTQMKLKDIMLGKKRGEAKECLI